MHQHVQFTIFIKLAFTATACDVPVAHRQAIWYTEDTNGKGSILYWKYKTIYNGIPHSAPLWNWNCGSIKNT